MITLEFGHDFYVLQVTRGHICNGFFLSEVLRGGECAFGGGK